MKFFLSIFYFILFDTSIYCQTPGSLDATFGTNGKVITSMTGFKDRANDVVVQSDDKILAVGISFNAITSGYEGIQMIRLNTNGTFDNTFGTNGKVSTKIDTTKGLYSNNVVLQADGKIIVAGNCEKGIFLVRYNTNGVKDNSFDGDGIAIVPTLPNEVNNILAMALQADGKILLAGENNSNPSSSNTKSLLLRLNANGTLDNTFNTNGKVLLEVNAIYPDRIFEIAVQNDGKILLCGHVVTDVNYKLSATLLRYNVNGSLDATFGTNGIIIQPNSEARSVKILNNGNILIGGSVFDYINNTSSNGLFLYNLNGTLVNTFGSNGIVKGNSGTSATDMVVQTDSKIILVSTAVGSAQLIDDVILSKYNTNGTPDNTFGTNGISTIKLAIDNGYRVMSLQRDGKIVVCGALKDSIKSNFAVVRFNNTIGTAIKSVETKEKISVFPIPMRENVLIRFDDIDVYKIQIEITDALGHILIEKKYDRIYKSQDITINVENLPLGLYFVRFKSDNVYQTQSIFKQ